MTRINFIRQCLPYLKLIRDNQYTKDMKINQFINNGCFECEFYFEPFKDMHQIKLRIALMELDDSTGILPNFKSYSNSSPSHLIDDYFMEYKSDRQIVLSNFEHLLYNVHEWVIDRIIKGQKDYRLATLLIDKYIPDSYKGIDDLDNYVRSKYGSDKFNL